MSDRGVKETSKSLIVVLAFALAPLAGCGDEREVTSPDRASDNNEAARSEWRTALPDPRIGAAALHAQAEDTHEIWCVPGCRLSMTADGDPVVPGWCTAWTELGDVNFVRESPNDVLDENNAVVAFEPRDSEKQVACIRIDLNKVKKDSTPGADGALTKLAIDNLFDFEDSQTPSFDQVSVGMNCNPGCTLDWGETGFMISDFNNTLTRTGVAPRWCVKRHDGCRNIISGYFGACGAQQIKNALCTRLRFKDVNYGSSETSVNDSDRP